MRLQCPWDDSPLAALTRVRAQRQLRGLPASGLWPWLLATFGWFLALRLPDHYPLYLGWVFVGLFLTLPGMFFRRDMSQLKSLREGRCLEEMLAVGLTPVGIADTLAWSSTSGLLRLASQSWMLTVVPALILGPELLRSVVLAALPAGLLLMGLSVYLRQVLLVLADNPGLMLRRGLKLYAFACLAVALPLYVFAFSDSTLGLQLINLGLVALLGVTRAEAISLWRSDLMPGQGPTGPAASGWGSWLVGYCSNPILVRELRASRGHSLLLWGVLPVLVLVSVGLALPLLVKLLGAGAGFFTLWLVWRLANFSVLAERARGLVQKERQGGSWELLVQVGLAGPQFVRGWALATVFRHFGWMAADLLGLLWVAHFHPDWVIPGASAWAGLWVLWLWGLGLMMDATAFLAGLGLTGRLSLLPGLTLLTALGEVLLCLGVVLGWLDSHSSFFQFAWQQAVPALALGLLLSRLALHAWGRLAEVLDPLNSRPAALSLPWEVLPQRCAQAVWVVWLLTSPTLAGWRSGASPLTFCLVLALGLLAWNWLFLPVAWALAPLGGRLALRRGWSALLTGPMVGAVCAVPVALAVEARHFYWMFTGQTLAGIERTHLTQDLRVAVLVGIATAWALQFLRWRKGQTAEAAAPAGGRLALVSLAGLGLAGLVALALQRVFPVQLDSTDQAWYTATQQRLARRTEAPRWLTESVTWDDEICLGMRQRTRLGLSTAHSYYVSRPELLQNLRDEAEQGRLVKALERALALDTLETYRVLEVGLYHELDLSYWSDLLYTLDQSPPEADEIRRLLALAEASLRDNEIQRIADEDFLRRLGPSPQDWWPAALRVASVTNYLQETGRKTGSAPAWLKHHTYPTARELRELTLHSQAWRTLLAHRADMALGGPEWPDLYASPGGLVIGLSRADGYVTYWLADGRTINPARLKAMLKKEAASSGEIPGEVLYTVQER